MEVHQDWATTGFSLAPVAGRTSVFPHRRYLEAWWRHFGTGDLDLVEDATALLPLWRDRGALSFAGDEDLTDYHSPLGSGSGPLLGSYLAGLAPGTRFRFDSLPGEAADELGPYLPGGSTRAQHEAAFRIELPADFDGFLLGLSKKERHELRRKHRRFSEARGIPRLLSGTEDAVGLFVELHRMAEGDKGQFMTAQREAFFRELAELPEARVDLVAGDDGTAVAAAFGFQDGSAYYLYNSAYDPAQAAVSPGMVLLWVTIEAAIEQGLTTFDFLKGDEAYKLRLGATPRPLFALEGRT